MDAKRKSDHHRGELVLDRPSQYISSIDAPWEDPSDRSHRMKALNGDRASHRLYHSLYEDMLN